MGRVRQLRRADGRLEIVRVLSASDAVVPAADSPLAYERSIVWLHDIATLRFVRTVEVRCARSRRGRLRLNSGERLIGYAKLLPDAPRDPRTQRFTRRLFYLKDIDFRAPVLPAPSGAVDPRTVLPGVRGEPPVE